MTSTAPPTGTDVPPRQRPTRRLWLRGGAAALAAAAVNVVLFLLARAAGVEFLVPDLAAGDGSSSALPVGPVVVSSLLGVLAATVGRWVHVRLTRLPELVFPVGVVLLLVASFAQPFAVAVDMSPAGQLVLCLLHVVVAAAVLLGLGRRGRL